MPLEFLNNLNDEQIVDLINYILKSTSNHKAKQVQVFREPDRCDEFGNQAYLVNVWDDNFHIGMYSVQDFIIRDIFEKVDLKDKLREYMAFIFGEEYLNALRNFYLLEADKEIERIKSTLGEGRS